jgi:hypothetical protein
LKNAFSVLSLLSPGDQLSSLGGFISVVVLVKIHFTILLLPQVDVAKINGVTSGTAEYRTLSNPVAFC